MKFFIFLAILPCIWAFNGTHIQCPDETACPLGKTCCADMISEKYNCCDVKESEKENKKLIPAFQSHYLKNGSKEIEKEGNDTCPGHFCFHTNWCCKYQKGSCCSNTTSCCPSGFHCCGTAPPHVWCCRTKQRCAESYLYCIAGASSLSSTLSLILILVMAVSLKHF